MWIPNHYYHLGSPLKNVWSLVTCLMSSDLWEGLSCNLLPPDSHRLSSGSGPWDLLYEGLGHPEYLLRALPVVIGALDPCTHFLGEAVDPLGWDWGWVPRGLPLACRSSLKGCYENNNNNKKNPLRFEFWGGLSYENCVSFSLGWVFTLIRTVWTLFFHFCIQKVFNAKTKNKKTTSWMGLAPLPRVCI